MLVEIHMLKNYAPTNLNRDDSGSPKTCMFGGVQRGRISSQCLKHSWRSSELFKESIGEENLGIRTRKLPELVADSLREDGIDEKIIETVVKKITGIGTKDGKEQKDNKTGQIVFYSKEDIKSVVDWVKDYLKKNEAKKLSAKELQEQLKKNNKRSITLDMALFGRMVTSDAFADVEASMQVAHAISTNRIMMESDFFTAVDDLMSGEDGDTGSAMMGDVDYNSSCYYMYSSIDTDKLAENLEVDGTVKVDISNVMIELLRTMAFTSPTGKQNSFAGHSLPSAILIECKERKIPVSYANAFEVPVRAAGNGLVENSEKALLDECMKIQKGFDIPVEQRLWFTTNPNVRIEESLGTNCDTFNEMLDKLFIRRN